MGIREFRWLPHEGLRHAIPDALTADQRGRTLCGVPVTVPRVTPPAFPDGCWPTCRSCDAEWRKREGIPSFPRQRPGSPVLAGR
ncbi:zinc finger protein [Saccharothrix coeruleofusca]|uniref:Zinc finger protein n=1 Tax=Saccharothrix coeruleofusca TaxID=33919 RepID=A0A918AS98_9PSEU|nr:zinc finger protein [Saccharothrix coeruleofusca]MBP2336665.1 hypothetical protein [Saccharothrix coeruleofusca]GGP78869.1 hypothetical protein GCM10010185_60910 [Saccharothrix coeruleofusca]